MKLQLLILLSFALATSVAAADVRVIDGFLSESEVEDILSSADLSILKTDTKTLGVADVSASLVDRIDAALNDEEDENEFKETLLSTTLQDKQQADGTFPIATSIIHKTTPIHQDHYWNEDGSHGDMVKEQVIFMFLNTNDKAMFVVQEGQQQIPVIKGNLVTFSGDMEHNTVVMSGEVKLLGPFDHETLEIVGPTPTAPTAPAPTPPVSHIGICTTHTYAERTEDDPQSNSQNQTLTIFVSIF